mgnify:CR=1 FL=1
MSSPPRGRALLLGAVLLDLVGFAIVLPLLPGVGARFEERALVLGALVAADSACAFVLAPRWGRLSDRIGRRPVLLVGFLGSVAAYLLFALAGSFGALLLSRVVSGSLGATFTVAQAWLADGTPRERRAHVMGLLGAAYGIAFTLGPAIGGIAARRGDALPGFIAAGLSATAFLLVAARLPESRERMASTGPASLAGIGRRAPYVLAFGTTAAFTALYVAFPLYCERALGFDRRMVSWMFALLGLVTVIVQGRLAGLLAPVAGERRLAVAGALLMGAGFALVPLAGRAGGTRAAAGSGVAVLALAVVVLSAGFGLAGPSVAALVSRRAGQDRQGRALGELQRVTSFARVVGPPLAGAAAQWGGLAAPFAVAAGVAAVAALAGAREDAAPADGREER